MAEPRGLAPHGPRPCNGKGARRPRGTRALSPPAGNGSDGAAGRAARRLVTVAVVTDPLGDVPAACGAGAEPSAEGGSGSEVPPPLQRHEGMGAGRGGVCGGKAGVRRGGRGVGSPGSVSFLFFCLLYDSFRVKLSGEVP